MGNDKYAYRLILKKREALTTSILNYIIGHCQPEGLFGGGTLFDLPLITEGSKATPVPVLAEGRSAGWAGDGDGRALRQAWYAGPEAYS